MAQVTCDLCLELVDEEIFEYHRGVEEHILDVIREHNPAWVLPDGTCPKAVEFYRGVVLGRKPE